MFRTSALLTLLFLVGISCVQIKQQTLYDGVEPPFKPEKPKSIGLVVEPVIYDDNAKDMWGLEKDVCKEVKLSKDIAYNSNESIYMKWDRGAKGCDWAGIGIGWDSYAGKDLTEVMDYAAIQFYVRSIEGKSFGLPIVLTLEDYSGGMGFCYTSNKYFERTTIDEEWQRVVAPLADFDLETEDLDITNIKQLQMEFQQSGSFYMDDIRLVFFEPEPVEPWMEEEKLPDPAKFPISLFEESFINNNSFGVVKVDCQDFNVVNGIGKSNTKGISMKWEENENCDGINFGISWNKWRPVDLSGVIENAALQFDLKNVSSDSDVKMRVGFEDYERAIVTSSINPSGDVSFTKDQWTNVTVPLKDIPSTYDPKRIKHLLFTMKGKGDVIIDNIRLVDYPQ